MTIETRLPLQPQPQPQPTWAQRMAKELSDTYCDGPPESTWVQMLETAGEIKAARVKVLLGRAYEIIRSITTEEGVSKYDDLLAAAKAELQ